MFKVELSQFLLLTVKISSGRLVSVLSSIVLLQGLHQGLRVLFRVHSVGSYLIRNKGKLAKMTTRYHSLSFVVPLVITRCTLSFFVFHCRSLYYSLPLVVTRCHSMYHLSVFLSTIRECSVGKS